MGIPAWKLAACALLCAMGACRAQAAVTVYGIVDAGLAYIDNGARHGASSVAMRSGILSGSLVGLQGSEELGEGLRAVFQLETDFNLGNGQAATYYGDPASATAAEPRGQPIAGGFNRRAYVGVESRHGSLSLGRDYTPLYWSMVEVDPLKLAGYGNMQQIVQLSGTGSERFGRASNALFYATSVTSDGLQLRLMGSFGSQGWGGPDRRPADANRMWGASVAYYAGGGAVLTTAYQQLRLPRVAGTPPFFTGAAGTRHDLLVGGRYPMGNVTLAGGYFRAWHPEPGHDGGTVWAGGVIRFARGVLAVNVQRAVLQQPDGRARATVIGASYVYPVSPKISFYLSYGLLNNTAASALTLGGVPPAGAGADVRAYGAGMRFIF